LIREDEFFTVEDMISLLCEAKKFGELTFTLPYSFEHYFRRTSADKKGFLTKLSNNLIKQNILTESRLFQIKDSEAKSNKIQENKIYYAENVEHITQFVTLEPMYFLAFLIENDKITYIFQYTEINQDVDLIINYVDESKFKIKSYISKINNECEKNIVFREEGYF
jgi:hypothetical protein